MLSLPPGSLLWHSSAAGATALKRTATFPESCPLASRRSESRYHGLPRRCARLDLSIDGVQWPNSNFAVHGLHDDHVLLRLCMPRLGVRGDALLAQNPLQSLTSYG